MTSLLPPNTQVLKRPGVRCESSVPGQYTLIDNETGQAHHLNATASMIWDMCDQQVPIEELASNIVQTYDVEPDQAFGDVCKVVLHWAELGVIEIQ